MRLLDWSRLLSPNAKWARLVVCPESDVDDFVQGKVIGGEANTLGKPAIRIIRGTRCQAKDRLFQEWAAALQFPYYFGNNWDAWEECIQDLSWLPASGYVFFVTQIGGMLPDDPAGFGIMVDILGHAVEEWATPVPQDNEWHGSWPRPGIPFRIIFHSQPEDEILAKVRLEKAGVNLSG